MQPIRVIIHWAKHNKLFEYQTEVGGSWRDVKVSVVAQLARVKANTVRAYCRTLKGHVVHDITTQCLAWQAADKRRYRTARRAKLGIVTLTPRQRGLKSWESRRARLAYQRAHITSMRAVGAAPDPFASNALASADQSESEPVFETKDIT